MAKVKVGRKAIEAALRIFVPMHIDYDMHKELEQGELDGTGEDAYPHLAGAFLKYLQDEVE